MNGGHQESGGGIIVLIILLVVLYLLCNPIPGPLDDAAVAALGGYGVLKKR